MTGLPAALRPAWSASSFLAYSGALTVLVSLVALLGDLGDRHGSWGLAGWTALVLVVLVVLSGSFDDGVGLADDVAPLDDDLELAPLLVEVAVLAAAGLRRQPAPVPAPHAGRDRRAGAARA